MSILKRFKSVILITIVLISVVLIGGCGFVADGPFGWIYTDTKIPVAVGPSETGTLEGKACINSFLGMITIGDASIEAAMKAHGIKTIYTVNKESLSIFGTYTRQCTIVTGEAEIAKKTEASSNPTPAPAANQTEGTEKKEEPPKAEAPK